MAADALPRPPFDLGQVPASQLGGIEVEGLPNRMSSVYVPRVISAFPVWNVSAHGVSAAGQHLTQGNDMSGSHRGVTGAGANHDNAAIASTSTSATLLLMG